jgi:hypothetical protein
MTYTYERVLAVTGNDENIFYYRELSIKLLAVRYATHEFVTKLSVLCYNEHEFVPFLEFSCYTDHTVRCGCAALFEDATVLDHVNVKEAVPI